MFARRSRPLADNRIADCGQRLHNKRIGRKYRKRRHDHSSEAPKMISAAAPAMRGDKLATKRSQAGGAPLVLPVAAGVVVTPVTVGVVSPSELDAFPRSELAKEHT